MYGSNSFGTNEYGGLRLNNNWVTSFSETIKISGAIPKTPKKNRAETIKITNETQNVSENVYGITSPKFKQVFNEIYSSLEAEGYEVQAYIIPASAIDAPHKRERVWFIAYAGCYGQQRRKQGVCKAFKQGYDEKDLFASGICLS